MILDMIIVFLLVLMAVIAVNTIKEYKKKSNSKISFKESIDLTELPVVTFCNGEKKLNFLLDTGSNNSHINSSILHFLDHIKINQKIDVIGAEGNKVNNEMCKMTIHYRNQKFEEEFIISDLNDAFDIIKQEDGVQIHGILGNKFFEKYKYILDFKDFIAYMK